SGGRARPTTGADRPDPTDRRREPAPTTDRSGSPWRRGLDWSAADCQVEGRTATRVYVGSDGVMVPPVTDAEKATRRQKLKEKRRRRGRKARPLPPRKAGADQWYKVSRIITLDD